MIQALPDIEEVGDRASSGDAICSATSRADTDLVKRVEQVFKTHRSRCTTFGGRAPIDAMGVRHATASGRTRQPERAAATSTGTRPTSRRIRTRPGPSPTGPTAIPSPRRWRTSSRWTSTSPSGSSAGWAIRCRSRTGCARDTAASCSTSRGRCSSCACCGIPAADPNQVWTTPHPRLRCASGLTRSLSWWAMRGPAGGRARATSMNYAAGAIRHRTAIRAREPSQLHGPVRRPVDLHRGTGWFGTERDSSGFGLGRGPRREVIEEFLGRSRGIASGRTAGRHAADAAQAAIPRWRVSTRSSVTRGDGGANHPSYCDGGGARGSR